MQSVIKKLDLTKVPIHLVAIPITTHRAFVYCRHQKALTGNKPSLNSKVTEWGHRAWSKLESSELKVNVKTVEIVNKLLEKIPWEETCLRSVPSQSSIVRELCHIEGAKEAEEKRGSYKPIPVYYPSSLIPETTIFNQLSAYAKDGYSRHLKYLVYSLLGIPLTIPFILLPLVPNIPGFYLCYRAWCHYNALMGTKHLQYLVNKEERHLSFTSVDNVIEAYSQTKDVELKKVLEKIKLGQIPQQERLLLGKDVIEDVARIFDAQDLTTQITASLRQESRRLENIKE